MKIPLIVVLGVAIILLFGSMVLAAMTSSHADQGEVDKAKKYATIVAVADGIAAAGLCIYIYMNYGMLRNLISM